MLSNALVRCFCCRLYIVRGLLVVVGVTAGGCSADVTRFDFPAFDIAEPSARGQTGSLPIPPEPLLRNPSNYEEGAAGRPRGAGLSDAPAAGSAPYSERFGSMRPDAPPPRVYGANPPSDAHTASRAPKRDEQPRVLASGESVQVQQGDSLHAIARRHGVSIGALIEVNGLSDGAALKPGQRLLLPAVAQTSSVGAPRAGTPRVAGQAPVHVADPRPQPGWGGHHTLQAGESLYGVARQYGVDVAELQRANRIAQPTSVRAGTVLLVPLRGEKPALNATLPASPPAEANPPAEPRIINQPAVQQTASLGNRADDASPPAPSSTAAEATGGKFRWPARGRVIASFGTRTDGTHNDGINIALPLGTDIHAVEAGRIAYAGSELKGYGNLVLIRHDNGWVSAYAHADEILVKRDDRVKRGQIIARAGKTGSVDQPQLHFELRQGSKPVDPLPHLER